jgi:hypothetical protein
MINDYKTSGTSIKTLLNSVNDDECVIESRVYGGTEKTELLLFKGNDATGANGADRIRLRAGNIAFDTYSSTTTNRNLENIVMLINENGNVGIGTTTTLTNKLNVNGTISATSFSGNGAALTNLTYANIDGKPTNFQADWNSTIINKPATFPATMTTIYTKTETDNLLNAKQATLTAATNLLGIGSSISALDYTKITIGKPTNFQADWTSTIINKPSTFPADMTTIYTKTEVNSAISTSQTASSNYTINTSNILQTNINTKQATLTATTNLLGIGSSISALDYAKITIGKPTNFQADC